MRLWIWSDLHLEMQNIDMPSVKPEGVDAIVFAGDLCRAPDLERVTREIFARYQVPIIFVPGNHEFYRGADSTRSIETDRILLRNVSEKSRDWLYVLDEDVAEIGGVRFVGGTLWTDFMMGCEEADLPWRMNSARALLADFGEIMMSDRRFLKAQVILDLHKETAAFIRRQLVKPFSGKTVVVTHHLPHPACTPAIYSDEPANYLFACSERTFGDIFTSDAAPALWVCGHTHHPVDVTVGRTRIVCNPRGYMRIRDERENGFRWDLVIDTETL